MIPLSLVVPTVRLRSEVNDLRIGSDGVLYANTTTGKVGVGTTNPQNKLHVEGTNGGSAGIYLNDAVPNIITNTLYNSSSTLMWNGSSLSNQMIFPSAGIAVSTGAGWGTPIADNSANWNTAYGWGNHGLAGYFVKAGQAGGQTAVGGNRQNAGRLEGLGGDAKDFTSPP